MALPCVSWLETGSYTLLSDLGRSERSVEDPLDAGAPVREPSGEGRVEELLADHLGAASERFPDVVDRLGDREIARCEGERELVDALTHLGEEHLAGRGNSAAHHDRAGIEHVDEGGDRLAHD